MTNYCLWSQSMKPPLQKFSLSFHPDLCCWWVIKVLPNQMMQMITFLLLTNLCPNHHPSCAPSLEGSEYSSSHYIFFSPLEFSPNLSYRESLKKRRKIFFSKHTSHICMNIWKLMGEYFHISWNKSVTPPDAYIWVLLRLNPITTSTSSELSSLIHLPTNLIYYIFPKPVWNIPHFFLIKPTQFTPLIQLPYHLWNHIILRNMNYWKWLIISTQDILCTWLGILLKKFFL